MYEYMILKRAFNLIGHFKNLLWLNISQLKQLKISWKEKSMQIWTNDVGSYVQIIIIS